MDTLLPAMVILLMMGMGSSVDKVQAQGAIGRWKAIIVGMFSQFVFMPFCAWLLGIIFDLSATERIGLIIVGCTPGGTTSQLFTYWSKGSVALSIIMTTASTGAALFMMFVLFAIFVNPYQTEVQDNSSDVCMQLISNSKYGGPAWASTTKHGGVSAPAAFVAKGVTEMPQYCWDTFVSPDEWSCAEKYKKCNGDLKCLRADVCDRTIKPDMAGIITMLALVVLPALIGFVAREPCFGESKQSRWNNMRKSCQTCVARWMTCIGSAAGGIVVLVLIAYGAVVYDYVWEAKAEIWFCCILIGLLGFMFGYFVSRFCGFSIRESRTISLETGIQNGPLAILIVKAAFPECVEGQSVDTCIQKQALLFPYLYSIWVVINSCVIVFGIYTRQRPEPIPEVPKEKSRALNSAARGSLFQDGDAPTGSFSLPESRATYDATGKVPMREIKTLYDSFQRGARLHGDRPCLGTRQNTGMYKWHTYNDVNNFAQDLGSGLRRKCNMLPGDFLAIMAPNRAEWIIAAEAAHTYNFVKVPLYDTLGADAIKHIVSQTGLKVVICTDSCQADLEALKTSGECPSLQHIVVISTESLKICGGASNSKIVNIGDLGSALDAAATPSAGSGITVSTFLSIMTEGRKNRVQPTPATDPNSNCMLCYTSGTTGLPKGAEISHGNMIATMGGLVAVDRNVQHRGERSYFFDADDIHISFLPLAHIFEQLNFASLLCVGGRAGFYSGSIPLLMEDIAVLRPTIFCAVPRLLNKLHDKVMARVEAQKGWCGAWPPPALAKKLFKNGFAKKKTELPMPSVEHGFWDATVFSNVAQRLGGRVRVIITGSAPISADVLDFLRIAFSCNVVEGYGQTESTAAITLSYPHDTSTGHAGVPIPSCEVKLVDVPEMDYLSSDTPCPRGEVCCRGPNVFKGYYKEPEKTAEAIDKDGWLHTGDIGQWNADGTLKIIDRKKNIFKLSQGEYVAPEKLESVAQSSQYIAQAFIYGDSLKHQLVSIIVPDFEVLKNWARDQPNLGVALGSGPGVDADGKVAPWYTALCALPAVKTLIMAELGSTAKAANLKGFEKAKEATIEAQPFDADRGLLTPTFKPKRPQLRKHYQAQLDAMYAALGI
jgi:long-chain acyl-CoA synthetase